MRADRRQFRQRDLQALLFAELNGRLHTAAIDEHVRAFTDVSAVQRHRFLITSNLGKLLSTTLAMNFAERPQRGLRMIVICPSTMPRGERANELALARQLHQAHARVCPCTIDGSVVVAKLHRHRLGILVFEKDAFALQHHAAFTCGGFQRIKQRSGERFIGTCGIERNLPGKRSGETGASLQHHVPYRIKSAATAPGELPDAPLGIAGLGDAPIEIEIDDVQPALRQDKKAIVSTAPRGCIHATPGCVGAHPKRHAMAVAADIGGAAIGIIVSFNVKQLEAFLRPLG